MKKTTATSLLCACVIVLITPKAIADVLPLEGRLPLTPGGTDYQAYYDPNLDITWAANANINGQMDWDSAVAWAASLTIGGVSGWRLPYISKSERMRRGVIDPIDCTFASEVDCRDNELGYMFYHNLSGTVRIPIHLSGDPDLALFQMLQSDQYWSNQEYSPSLTSLAFFFSFQGGFNYYYPKTESNTTYSWAVRDGDVGGTQEPPTVDLTGTVKTANGLDICAMVLASGQYRFSCDPIGEFALTDLPRENDGTVKRQIYADGFFPKIDILTGSINDAVVMTRSGTCPDYNLLDEPGFFPSSAGKWIDISGRVVVGEDQQTSICAMVLANGQYMFSCDGAANYALNVPLDSNGQVKLQVYADGFAPTILNIDEFNANNDVKMARALECQSESISGEEIYNMSCSACHTTGVAGAPKLGDVNAWAPRIAAGMDSLLNNTINGLNAMPPRGACLSCSDAELLAAIEYMLSKLK